MSVPSLTKTYRNDTYSAISPTKPSLSQAGKTILITGGGGGIGFEIARSFAKASAARIVIVGRRSGILDEAAAKLKEEFSTGCTEIIARQGNIADDSSIISLWDFLHSQNIFVDVLVLNAAHLGANGPDTLSLDKKEVAAAFNINIGGNFFMAAKFVQQPLRPKGKKLNLVHISTAGIQMHPSTNQNVYATSKAGGAALFGRIAAERSVEDVQINIFHPGIQYSESAAKAFDRGLFKWDEMALPADYAVWATSPEAAWLHGRFVWANWDVDELKADKSILKRFTDEPDYLKVGVVGLTTFPFTVFMNN